MMPGWVIQGYFAIEARNEGEARLVLRRLQREADIQPRIGLEGASAKLEERASREYLITPEKPEEMPGQYEIPPNQHYPGVGKDNVIAALCTALDFWERTQCDCCSPALLDEALEKLVGDSPDIDFWDRMRRFGIQLAVTAQDIIEHEREESDEKRT